MTSLNAHLEYGLLRPIRERLPVTEHIPNHWLVLIGGTSITGVLSLLGSLDLAGMAAGVLGVGTAFATAIAFIIVKVGQARIQVDRERLAYEKDRAVALDGTLAGKLEHLSELLDEAKSSAEAQKELNATLKATIGELKAQSEQTAKRLEDANRKLHDLANEANRVNLQHVEEVARHTEETVTLRGELAKVNGQLAEANAQLVALREENERLNRLVHLTAKKTVENKAAIEATNAKVDRMQQDSGSIPTLSGNAANEPTVDMPTMPDPTQPAKPV